MQYIVRLENKGVVWMLKKTTWTSAVERADRFDSEEDARKALDYARQFMKPSLWKLARFEKVE